MGCSPAPPNPRGKAPHSGLPNRSRRAWPAAPGPGCRDGAAARSPGPAGASRRSAGRAGNARAPPGRTAPGRPWPRPVRRRCRRSCTRRGYRSRAGRRRAPRARCSGSSYGPAARLRRAPGPRGPTPATGRTSSSWFPPALLRRGLGRIRCIAADAVMAMAASRLCLAAGSSGLRAGSHWAQRAPRPDEIRESPQLRPRIASGPSSAANHRRKRNATTMRGAPLPGPSAQQQRTGRPLPPP
ncbi:hypothetical protein D9M71_588450 [compost metagenome]